MGRLRSRAGVRPGLEPMPPGNPLCAASAQLRAPPGAQGRWTKKEWLCPCVPVPPSETSGPRRKRDFSQQLHLSSSHPAPGPCTHMGHTPASEDQALSPRDPSKLSRQGQLGNPRVTTPVLHSPEGPCVTALGSFACSVNPFTPSEHLPVRGLCSGARVVSDR